MYSPVLVVLSLVCQMTAEGFLQMLCDTASSNGGPAYWLETAAEDADERLANPDTLETLLPTLGYLSVIPGAPRLLQADNSTMSYTVSYPDAEWNWTDTEGRVHRARGETVVEQREGRFFWVRLPLYRSASAGPMEKLILGLTLTGIVLLFGVIVLWWVRRRYRQI